MRVVLTQAEKTRARDEAIKRQDDAIAKRRHARYGNPTDDYEAHIIGAMGELAVAKALKIEWDGNFGDLGAADVGSYQVRSTKHAGGGLIVHPGEKGVFILVTGKDGVYDIRGWAMAGDVQNPLYWKGGWSRPAFLMPQIALNPMHSLPVLAHSDRR